MKLYLDGRLSDEDLFLLGNPKTVTLLAMNGDMRPNGLQKMHLTELPKDFRPSANGLFEAGNCPDLSEIRAELGFWWDLW